VSTPELRCALEVRDGVVWISLQGALRASGRTALTALVRARRVANRSYPTVVDLSGLEVADALGVAALRRVLRRFVRASVVLPPPWTQARTIVHAHLAGFHVVERSSDLDLP
jgi:ABC-type transporter Mla MlaB component